MPIITDKFLLNRWYSFYGDRTVNRFQYHNKHGIAPFIRTNTLKISSPQLEQRLSSKRVRIESGSLKDSFKVLKSKISIGALNEYLFGYYSIQGLASQLTSLILDPKPDDKVLDMSAAPGGKTSHLASLMDNSGSIIAIDKSKKRISGLRSNLSRLGVLNTICFEGRSEDLVPSLGKFDKVLLDAPCTGSGSICKNPSRNWNRTQSDIDRLSDIQEQLIVTGLSALTINGEMVYSTCSLEPEEGELQILKLLENYHDSIKIHPIQADEYQLKTTNIELESIESTKLQKLSDQWIRTVPSDDIEGFFICKITKVKEI